MNINKKISIISILLLLITLATVFLNIEIDSSLLVKLFGKKEEDKARIGTKANIGTTISTQYIYRNYIKEGDLFFELNNYSEAKYHYMKAIDSLKNLQTIYDSRSDSESNNLSKDQLVDLLIVIENRLLLTTAAINSQETIVE